MGVRGWEWFWSDSSSLHLLCTLFPLLLHQLHLRSSGLRLQRLGTPGFKTLWQISQSTYRKSALALELFCQLNINVCMKLLKYMQQGYQTLGEEGGCVEEWGGEQVEAGEGRGNLWFVSHVPQRASLIWVHLPAWGPWVRRADGATVHSENMGFLVSPLFPPFSPSQAYIGFQEQNKGFILCP